jgi:hypothetical protein
MPRQPKLPFDALPGLPSHDDKEVTSLMAAVERMPRDGANEVARCLVRAALGCERTGDTWYLTCLAEDTLFTMRLRSDSQRRGPFEAEPGSSGPGTNVRPAWDDVENSHTTALPMLGPEIDQVRSD